MGTLRACHSPRSKAQLMIPKEPVLLTILIETARLRWLAGGIGFDQDTVPLLASQDDDLAGYRDQEFDAQASFLRHRFCGALQRGCDRLWGLRRKACHFVFVTDRILPHASPELTERVAEHLAQWMTNPPVVFFSADRESFDSRPVEITRIAGDISAELLETLQAGLPQLLDAASDSHKWEQVPLPKADS